MSSRNLLIIAAFSGAAAVSLGAFGAHALKSFLLESNRLETYQTAVQYHFYHTLLLLFIGFQAKSKMNPVLKWSGIFTVTGILFFSGSLYMLCFTESRLWGPVTPIGGVFLILAWLLLCVSLIRNKKVEN